MNLSADPLQRESSDPWWAIFDVSFSFKLYLRVVFSFFSVDTKKPDFGFSVGQSENQGDYVEITQSI